MTPGAHSTATDAFPGPSSAASIFFINVPVGAVAAALVLRLAGAR